MLVSTYSLMNLDRTYFDIIICDSCTALIMYVMYILFNSLSTFPKFYN